MVPVICSSSEERPFSKASAHQQTTLDHQVAVKLTIDAGRRPEGLELGQGLGNVGVSAVDILVFLGRLSAELSKRVSQATYTEEYTVKPDQHFLWDGLHGEQ